MTREEIKEIIYLLKNSQEEGAITPEALGYILLELFNFGENYIGDNSPDANIGETGSFFYDKKARILYLKIEKDWVALIQNLEGSEIFITQDEGESETAVMSQKSITEALRVMRKAMLETISAKSLADVLNKYVLSSVYNSKIASLIMELGEKATKQELINGLEGKVDIAPGRRLITNEEIDNIAITSEKINWAEGEIGKLNTDINTKVNTTTFNSLLSHKADLNIVTNLNNKYEELEQGKLDVNEYNTDISNVNEAVSGLDRRVGNVETDLGIGEEGHRPIKEIRGEVNAAVSGLNTRVGSVETRVGSVEEDLGGVVAGHESLNDSIGDINTAVSGLNTRVGSVETDLGIGEEGHRPIKQLMNNLVAEITTIKSDLDLIDPEPGRKKTRLALDTITPRVESIETTINSIIPNISNDLIVAKNNITNLQRDISGIVKDTTVQTLIVNEINAKLAIENVARVSDVETKLEKTLGRSLPIDITKLDKYAVRVTNRDSDDVERAISLLDIYSPHIVRDFNDAEIVNIPIYLPEGYYPTVKAIDESDTLLNVSVTYKRTEIIVAMEGVKTGKIYIYKY